MNEADRGAEWPARRNHHRPAQRSGLHSLRLQLQAETALERWQVRIAPLGRALGVSSQGCSCKGGKSTVWGNVGAQGVGSSCDFSRRRTRAGIVGAGWRGVQRVGAERSTGRTQEAERMTKGRGCFSPDGKPVAVVDGGGGEGSADVDAEEIEPAATVGGRGWVGDGRGVFVDVRGDRARVEVKDEVVGALISEQLAITPTALAGQVRTIQTTHASAPAPRRAVTHCQRAPARRPARWALAVPRASRAAATREARHCASQRPPPAGKAGGARAQCD